jgi:prophage tail gpP-like protein
MALTDTTNPAIGGLTLRVRPATSPSVAVEFTRFLSYEYTEDYLSPSDESYFELDEKELSPNDAAALKPGSIIQVVIDGNVQSAGIIDEVESNVDKGSGSVVKATCRDFLSLAVDAQVDPQTRFVPTMTLLDLLTACYAPFGINVFATDNIANRNVITGRVYGAKTSKKGRVLKSYTLGEEKPYPNEGVFAFTSRISQRFGLWIRPSATIGTVIVGKPDFDQEPRYGLQHVYGQGSLSNNIEKGHFKRSRKEQPSILYASGVGGGGVFAKAKLRSGITNPVIDCDNSKIEAAYPSVKLASVPAVTAAFTPLVEGGPRAAFLYDPESHTQEQLDAFLLRELSIRMRKALTARYEFMGHLLNSQPVCVDSLVNVNDARPTVQWQGSLWIISRRFAKSASAGTRTTIEAILPGSLVF